MPEIPNWAAWVACIASVISVPLNILQFLARTGRTRYRVAVLSGDEIATIILAVLGVPALVIALALLLHYCSLAIPGRAI